MTSTRAIRLVATRELREGMRNRTLRITFVVMLVAVAVGPFLPLLFDGDDGTTVGVASGLELDEAAMSAAADLADLDLELTSLADEQAATAAVDDGEVDAALVGTVDAPVLLVEQQADPTLRAVASDVLARQALAAELDGLGLDPDEGAAALASAPDLAVQPLDAPDDPGALPLAFGSTIFLFVAVTFFASRVMTGVVEEKSSRVVEVVLGAMRPEHLLAGKLLGVGGLAFGQVAALMFVAITSVELSGALELPATAAASAIGLVGWFVLGFATYSVVYAAAGALVTRVEDAQSTAGPIGILLFVAYVATFSLVLPQPDGLATRILSQVPGIAPLAMPARIALGSVTWGELVLALVLSLAALYGAVRLAGVIYRRSLLRTHKASWRETLARSSAG
jgi:ABC-2 type transport system permease protein